MKGLILLGAIAAAIVMFLRSRGSAAGYGGAIGFKNRHASEIATLSLAGFRDAITCRALARGEHSFNYVKRQILPREATIAWRFVGDSTDRNARVSLAGIPSDAADGELFFVLSEEGEWGAEFAPRLQIEKLQT